MNVDQPPGEDATRSASPIATRSTAASELVRGCHGQMDPIGFGLENYDIAGRYREHDDGLPECTIAGDGEVAGHGSFSGPAELGALLVDAGRARAVHRASSCSSSRSAAPVDAARRRR